MKYYTSTVLNTDFESATSRVKHKLQEEGFGVLSEIDLHEKFKEKLDVDFRKYRILGACNPPLAYKALQKEDKIGTMLPCNVILQEIGENKVEIAAIDPFETMKAVGNAELNQTALEVKTRLDRVLQGLT